MINITKYKTTDLGVCAYLVVKFSILNLERLGTNKFAFIFERTPELDKEVNAYFTNTAQISPLEYFNNLRSLKTRIYSET